MRISVDLSAVKIAALEALAKKEKRSRAALIREAVDDYLDGNVLASRQLTHSGFGASENWTDLPIRGNCAVNGEVHQRS